MRAVKTCSALALVLYLGTPAEAGWPDPHGTGNQELRGIALGGGLGLTDAENEFIVVAERDSYILPAIDDPRLARQLGDSFYDDQNAGDVFGYHAQQLYVFNASKKFAAAATLATLDGGPLITADSEGAGSILLGADFLRKLHRQSGHYWPLARAIVVYHEMAHVLLLNRGIKRARPREEALADRLAGYCLGRLKADFEFASHVRVSPRSIRALGRITTFTNRGDADHGSPNERIGRIQEGFAASQEGLALDAALDRFDRAAD